MSSYQQPKRDKGRDVVSPPAGAARRHAWKVVVAACLILSCRSGESVAPTPPVALILVQPEGWDFTSLADTVRLAAVARSARGATIPGVSVAWSSSDTTVAVVDTAGRVIARGNGTARITASNGALGGSSDIRVQQVPVSVELRDVPGLVTSLGPSVRVRAIVRDGRGTVMPSEPVQWSSSDPSLVTMFNDGLAFASGDGRVEIRARLRNGATASDSLRIEQRAAQVQFEPLGAMVAPRGTFAVRVTDSLGFVMRKPARVQLRYADGQRVLVRATAADSGRMAVVLDSLVPGAGQVVEAEVTGASGPIRATSAPFDVHLRLTSLAATMMGSCGLSHDGDAWCWGVAMLEADSSNTPVRVRTTGKAIGLAMTRGGCLLSATGQVSCWGSHWAFLPQPTDPVPLAAAPPLDAIAGRGAYCGLVRGTLAPVCWLNSSAYFDGAPPGDVIWETPVAAAVGRSRAGASSAIRTIQPGSDHFCLLDDRGVAFCGGSNAQQALGRDPTQVGGWETTPVATATRFHSLSVGGAFACGVAVDATVWCWGDNREGQLGPAAPSSAHAVPVIVSGISGVTSVAAGRDHACALTGDGRAYCWGHMFGPVPKSLGAHRFVSLASGAYHSCGIEVSGFTYCWGTADNGQIGHGRWAGSITPTLVLAPHVTTGNIPLQRQSR